MTRNFSRALVWAILGVGAVVVLVLIVAGVILFRATLPLQSPSPTEPVIAVPEPVAIVPEEGTDVPEGPIEALHIPVAESGPSGQAHREERESRSTPVTDGADAGLVEGLQASYDSGSIASRIRLQNELSQYWQDHPAAADQLATLIANEDAPPAFRIYIAKVFRNQVKRRSFDESAASNAFREVRGVIGDPTGDPEFRADVANVLTTVDQSDETIQSITPLLSSPDTVATKAISALCHTTSPLAIDAVYDFATKDPDLAKTKPKALAAALAPLSTTERDIVPTISHIVTSTDNFDLYRTAVQSLIRLPPSSATLAAISKAHAAAPGFGSQQPLAEQLCRAAAEHHLRRLRMQEDPLDQDKIKTLEELLNAGEAP